MREQITIRRAPVIYVAGPMAGLNWQGMNDWREEVERRMPDCEIRSPTRGKDWIRRVRKISGLAYETKPFGSVAAVLKRDHWDVRGSDLVLANFLDPAMVTIRDILKEHGVSTKAMRIPEKILDLGTEQASIGTMVEYGFAHAYHTPVIAIMREKSIHRHVFPLGITLEVVPDLDTGIFLARKLLNLPDEPVPLEGEVLEEPTP